MKIPENFQTVMPYLIVDGAEDFLKFAQQVFGAGQLSKLLREDGKGDNALSELLEVQGSCGRGM